MQLLMLNKRLEENFAQFHLARLSGSCFYTCRLYCQGPDLNRLPDTSGEMSGHEMLQWRMWLPFVWRLNRTLSKWHHSSSFKSLIWLQDLAGLPLTPLELSP